MIDNASAKKYQELICWQQFYKDNNLFAQYQIAQKQLYQLGDIINEKHEKIINTEVW